MNQKYRLSPSTIASYFKHRCDRQYRWESVEQPDRGRAGIGWQVPRTPRFHSRPGIALLMSAGDAFEVGRLEQLQSDYGPDQVYHMGFEEDAHGRRTVRPLPLPDLADVLRRPSPPRFAAQIFLNLDEFPARAGHFLARFGLNPAFVRVGTARPDLLEVVPTAGGRRLLRVWDFKASQAARHEHFIQVAFYTFLLEEALHAVGLDDAYTVDTEWGVIYARQGPDEFRLAPYRLAIEDFLRFRATPLLQTPATEAHYHVNLGCPMCQYNDSCRAEADAGRDLSRVAYMTSESKRRLVRAGIPNHRELARLSDDDPRWERLRAAGHDLSVNLGRYVEVARALDDGRPRPLHGLSLTIPRHVDVRVVLSAEQDPVTNTCFALGLKTIEWTDDGEGARGQVPGAREERSAPGTWPLEPGPSSGDGQGAREERSAPGTWNLEPGPSPSASRPRGTEHVFLLDDPLTNPDAEAQMLLAFLRQLNGLLLRVDAENAALAAQLEEAETPEVAVARRALDDVTAQLAELRAAYPRLYANKPDHQPLIERRQQLQAGEKSAKAALKEAQSQVWRENRRRQKRLHFYVFDAFDLTVLKKLVERHLFGAEPALLAELYTLVRLFPPESVLPDADSFRTIPGTVLVSALRQLVALPAPYVYDLRSVTELIPSGPDGRRPYAFRPPTGFVWRGTNQVAFERIHDVWRGQSFLPNPRDPATAVAPDEVRRRIEQAVRQKLRATEAVVNWLGRDYGDSLLLRKEPFRLYGAFDPLGFQTLEALRVFAMLETSQAELAVKHLHTLPVADRVARFECIGGLRYIDGADTTDGGLWFTFDRAARDVKFERGEFDLVLTPQDAPERLVSEIDGQLFNSSRWRHQNYKVTLVDYDLAADPPRVCLRPASSRFRASVDLAAVHSLDKVFVDYNTSKVLYVLDRLRQNPELARHVHELLDSAATSGWRPLIGDAAAVEGALAAYADRGGAARFLTAAQSRAFRGAPAAPLSLIWGPPGTGKTYMLGHLLLGYVLAARQSGQPVRILVTAFTHYAINNVLNKVSDLLRGYGLSDGGTAVVKVMGNQPHAADDRLPADVARVGQQELNALLNGDTRCLIAGSTVWGVYNAMQAAGDTVQPWFDVTLIDEASQMKLPEALIAFSAAKPDGAVILAGDDRQLPPIIHGDYPDEHAHMLTSVFAYMRQRIEERALAEPGFDARTIFQLEENFRMNKPLTDYPARMLYEDRFFSQQEGIRITTDPPLPADSDDPIDFMLHPDRPVVLVRYAAPVSFTARNSLEADIVARIAARLAGILVQPGRKDEGGGMKDAGSSFIPPPSSFYFAEDGFAVLSPHRAQNAAIRAALAARGFGTADRPLPLVDTVDKLQGQERDVVVVSYGVADEEYAEAEAAFLLSSHRFNVATTRPRRKLIVLCSDAVLDVVPQDRDVLLEAMMLKEFRGFCDGGPRTFVWETEEFGAVTLAVQWKAFERMESTIKQIEEYRSAD